MKVAIILQAGADERGEALARAVHALLYAQEIHDAGGEVKLIFDGAGTTWVGRFENPEFKYHALYQSVKKLGLIVDVCPYCASAFGVQGQVQTSRLPQIGAYQGHPSLVHWLREGYLPIVL